MFERLGSSVSRSPWLPLAVIAAAVGLSACADRNLSDENFVEDKERPERPEGISGTSEGYLYAACESVAECGGLEFCLRPRGELGFCSIECEPGREQELCGPSGDLDPRCKTIEGESICVLSCANVPCPMGMKCEDVKINGARERLCF